MNDRRCPTGFSSRVRRSAVLMLSASGVALGAAVLTAQIGTSTLEVPDWIAKLPVSSSSGGVLTLGDAVFTPDSTASQEELPGLGHKFELFGVMVQDTDPENAVGGSGGSGGGIGGNETISATMTPTSVALAYRDLPPGIKITALTNQLGLKYYFTAPRSCGGGSPRITLLVDAEGDGDTDFAAHGHVNPPVYAGCVMDKWKYEDLADDLPRWEVTPGGAVPGIPVFPFTPWKAFAAAVTAAFPNHKITAGFLVDDSCSFFPAACGKAYYDLVTIENRTLEIWQDTVRR
jgi:hypothetical protein